MKNVIKSKQQIKERGEDIRVLYVALTRAKEKLIITGAVNEENMSSSSDFSTSDIAGFKRFSELLYPIAINNKQAFNVRKYSLDVNEAAGFGEVDREARKKMLYKDIEVREFKPFCYPITFAIRAEPNTLPYTLPPRRVTSAKPHKSAWLPPP